MTGRREFLKAAGAIGMTKRKNTGDNIPGGRAVASVTLARELLRCGELGPVRFCRIGHSDLRPAAAYILGRADCRIEIHAGAAGAAFLGSRATLVVSGEVCRVFDIEGADDVGDGAGEEEKGKSDSVRLASGRHSF